MTAKLQKKDQFQGNCLLEFWSCGIFTLSAVRDKVTAVHIKALVTLILQRHPRSCIPIYTFNVALREKNNPFY